GHNEPMPVMGREDESKYFREIDPGDLMARFWPRSVTESSILLPSAVGPRFRGGSARTPRHSRADSPSFENGGREDEARLARGLLLAVAQDLPSDLIDAA